MGKPDAVIPPSWSNEYSTKINASSPLPVEFDKKFKMNTYFSVRFIPALTNIFYFNLSVGSIYNKIWSLELTSSNESNGSVSRYWRHSECHTKGQQIHSYLGHGLYSAVIVWIETDVRHLWRIVSNYHSHFQKIRRNNSKIFLTSRFWPVIDNALRAAAIDRRVSVKLLISKWKSSRPAADFFLNSLKVISNSYRGVDIQVVWFKCIR